VIVIQHEMAQAARHLHRRLHQVGARLPAAEDPMSLSVLPPTLR